MIIFDLDGTLANCEHRRHFVDPKKNPTFLPIYCKPFDYMNPNTGEIFKPNWKAFYEACDQDTPIEPVIDIWNQQISLGMMDVHQIWSGRCESVREKTEKWLDEHLLCFNPKNLKMRPIGDNTPDDQLKEKWLDEESICVNEFSGRIRICNPIDFVFDDRPKVIKMWRRRGIFVFDVNQSGEEF